MTDGEQFALGVLLGHEAYRDGDNNGALGQQLETQGAAKGHTEMLIRMLMEEQNVTMNTNLENDLNAYFQGENAFNSYVAGNYDSSADYWKLMKDENGEWGWAFDESLDFDVSEMMNDREMFIQFLSSGGINALVTSSNGEPGVIDFEKMSVNLASGLGRSLGIADAVLEYESSENAGRNFAMEQFIWGTMGLANVSNKANDLMNYVANAGAANTDGGMNLIAALNNALGDKSIADVLIRQTATINPFDPTIPFSLNSELDQILVTTLLGVNIDKGIVTDHGNSIDATVHDKNGNIYPEGTIGLTAPEQSVLSLLFTEKGGLGAKLSFGNDNSLEYKHNDPSSVMNYLRAFSSNGMGFTGSGINVPAGFIAAQMGNSGTQSDGPHDHITYNTMDQKNHPISTNPLDYFSGLNDAYMAYQNTYYKSLSQNDMTSVWNYLNDNKRYSDFSGLYNSYNDLMTQNTSDYARTLMLLTQNFHR
jgi:hypothetical protein